MFKRLSDDVWVAGQLREPDFAAAAAAGVRTVLNNRPDGEAPDQLAHARAEEAAIRAGLAYHYLPIANGHLTFETVETMRVLLREAEAPVLAYCTSGTRSTFLWAFASAVWLPSENIVEAARGAGYDLSGIAPQLDALHKR
ncbi:MAG: TIGR01244 family sulfur transferase [Alphaproteobacteria bacterium]